MHYVEVCSIKINLTLRVLGRREDGYHELHSLFWRLSSPEVLEISLSEEDSLSVVGGVISGANLVDEARSFLRTRFAGEPPPLSLRLFKHLPIGGGVGAGSGNAAALLCWHARAYACGIVDPAEYAALGADISFLASGHDLALADGIGERLVAVDAGGLRKRALKTAIFFPKWTIATKEAYEAIDRRREANVSPLPTIEEARTESLGILASLSEGKTVGLLPNDFLSCFSKHNICYNTLYDLFEKTGALAWGLCGSGSGCFAIYDGGDGEAFVRMHAGVTAAENGPFSWISKSLVVE